MPADAQLRSFPDGSTSVKPTWHAVFDKDRFPGVVHYASDGPIATSDTPWILANVVHAHPDQDITIFGGAHGEWYGQNWLVSGRRATDPRLLPADIAYLNEPSGRAATGMISDGRTVRLIDLAELTPEFATKLYQEPGIYIHLVCYGVVDEVLLALFKARPRPVYVSWPTP
ncbi:hypothetical protein KPL74_07470 [Bacillus sp. NP157]|nr:hypothetical protein KPL74_07470 [Bacillus sp. NP157]